MALADDAELRAVARALEELANLGPFEEEYGCRDCGGYHPFPRHMTWAEELPYRSPEEVAEHDRAERCDPPTTHRYRRVGRSEVLRCYRCGYERPG
jgi:hypothetical protein